MCQAMRPSMRLDAPQGPRGANQQLHPTDASSRHVNQYTSVHASAHQNPSHHPMTSLHTSEGRAEACKVPTALWRTRYTLVLAPAGASVRHIHWCTSRQRVHTSGRWLGIRAKSILHPATVYNSSLPSPTPSFPPLPPLLPTAWLQQQLLPHPLLRQVWPQAQPPLLRWGQPPRVQRCWGPPQLLHQGRAPQGCCGAGSRPRWPQ